MDADSSSSCGVCIETFNRKDRKEVICFRCGTREDRMRVCAQCVERYLLDRAEDACCMNCNAQWDRAFLKQTMSVSFMNKYKTHREQSLLVRERCMIPATMDLIRLRKQRDETDRRLKEVKVQLRQIQLMASHLQHQLVQESRQYHAEFRNVLHPGNRRQLQVGGGAPDATTTQDPEDDTKGRKCAHADCVGFLDRKGLCAVCNGHTCLKCNVAIAISSEEEDHICQDTDIATWKELQQSTKPCPNCQVRIFKISGCSQMWCSYCHTVFNWMTGQIQRGGTVHNPEYFQWLFGNRTNPLFQGAGAGQHDNPNAPCVLGQLPTAIQLYNALGQRGSVALQKMERLCANVNAPQLQNEMKTSIRDFFRLIGHIKDVDLRRLASECGIPPEAVGGGGYHFDRDRVSLDARNLLLREKFLMGELTEDEWKIKLQRVEKDILKKRELYQITDAYVTMQSDLFQRFVRQPDMAFNELLLEMTQVCEIANQGITNINQTYKSSRSLFVVPKLPAVLSSSS